MTKAPRARLVLTGTELLSGRRRDLIGPRLARRLEPLGCEIGGLAIVPDDERAIAEAVRAAVDAEADVVFVCGGLGPTSDDGTREAIAAALDRDLELDEDALARIEARYRERGREMPDEARRQARRPEESTLIVNPIGTAPGFMLEDRRSLVVALPGVPREFEAMLERSVLPRLAEAFTAGLVTATARLHVAGLAESEVHKKADGLVPAHDPQARIGYLALPGSVELVVTVRAPDTAEAEERRDEIVAELRRVLGDAIFGEGEATLAGTVRDLLPTGWTLGTAESCTGGLLGGRITDLDGASTFYQGGVVVYDDRQKEQLLGVPRDLLDGCGAVSAEVACAMADGCRKRLGVDVALSVTGIAGPSGGSADKPVGLVYVGVATPDGVEAFRHTMTGDRTLIRERSAAAALDEARRVLARRSHADRGGTAGASS